MSLTERFVARVRPPAAAELSADVRAALDATSERIARDRLVAAVREVDSAIAAVRRQRFESAIDALLDARNSLTGGTR